jgi:phosphatidylserine decarboxylase
MLMKIRAWRDRLLQQEDLNFLLTNRIPRLAATHAMGWFSQIRSPWLARLSIGVWRCFTTLDLSEAKQQRFDSLHDCFIRELKDGARPVDPDPAVLASPCDAIVGACGAVEDGQVWQAKGFPYPVEDLFGSAERAQPYRHGVFVTLRLTSAMYHHFHAPADGRVQHVTHMAGDTWNVNPIALKRVERLFCKNERAAIHLRLDRGGYPLALVPVAAVLVASLRLKFMDLLLHTRYRGPDELPCDVAVQRGQDLGWFQHGSTIIVFAPPGFALAEGIASGVAIRMGRALMRMP